MDSQIASSNQIVQEFVSIFLEFFFLILAFSALLFLLRYHKSTTIARSTAWYSWIRINFWIRLTWEPGRVIMPPMSAVLNLNLCQQQNQKICNAYIAVALLMLRAACWFNNLYASRHALEQSKSYPCRIVQAAWTLILHFIMLCPHCTATRNPHNLLPN